MHLTVPRRRRGSGNIIIPAACDWDSLVGVSPVANLAQAIGPLPAGSGTIRATMGTVTADGGGRGFYIYVNGSQANVLSNSALVTGAFVAASISENDNVHFIATKAFGLAPRSWSCPVVTITIDGIAAVDWSDTFAVICDNEYEDLS